MDRCATGDAGSDVRSKGTHADVDLFAEHDWWALGVGSELWGKNEIGFDADDGLGVDESCDGVSGGWIGSGVSIDTVMPHDHSIKSRRCPRRTSLNVNCNLALH